MFVAESSCTLCLQETYSSQYISVDSNLSIYSRRIFSRPYTTPPGKGTQRSKRAMTTPKSGVDVEHRDDDSVGSEG